MTHIDTPSRRFAPSPAARERCTVVGIGNDDRGDDGVGLCVARMLMQHASAYLQVEQSDGEAAALMHQIATARRAWLIDAAQSGAPPGTIYRIDCAADDTIMPRSSISSHGFGLAEAIGLARALGTLPPHCVVYAIEGTDFTPGAAPSPAVTRAAHEVAERILAELATLPPP